MAQHRKSVGPFALLSCFCLGRFHLGQIGLGILLLLLVPLAIGAIWSLVDLLRSRSIVEEINNRKAAEIARQMGIRAKISVAKLCRRGGAGL